MIFKKKLQQKYIVNVLENESFNNLFIVDEKEKKRMILNVITPKKTSI